MVGSMVRPAKRSSIFSVEFVVFVAIMYQVLVKLKYSDTVQARLTFEAGSRVRHDWSRELYTESFAKDSGQQDSLPSRERQASSTKR